MCGRGDAYFTLRSLVAEGSLVWSEVGVFFVESLEGLEWERKRFECVDAGFGVGV